MSESRFSALASVDQAAVYRSTLTGQVGDEKPLSYAQLFHCIKPSGVACRPDCLVWLARSRTYMPCHHVLRRAVPCRAVPWLPILFRFAVFAEVLHGRKRWFVTPPKHKVCGVSLKMN